MFIQRLQNFDIATFLCKKYSYDKISMFLEHKNTNDPYIYISINTLDKGKIEGRLYDFENINFAGNWQKFLYEKFGKEYYQEYEKYLDRLMIKRLLNLTKD